MPEYRLDPLTGHWVIIARERARRPSEFINHPVRRQVECCPFCVGNEHLTPPTIARYPAEDGTVSLDPAIPQENLARLEDPAPWQVRVFANKYPAVVAGSHDGPVSGGLYTTWPGHGVHEIVVESSQHTASFTELTEAQARWSFVAYRECLVRLANQPGLRYGLVFKNCRGGGGATLEHSHSQVLATALIPTTVQQELVAAERFQAQCGRCIFCDLLQAELAAGERVVAATDSYVVFCPYASRFPYETWLLPRQHNGRFESANLGDLDQLSRLFQRVLHGLEKILAQSPYNYWIHTSPFDTFSYDHYHWHIELIPRVTTQAGFEWGSGCFVNPVPPEEAAAELKQGGNLGG